MSSNFSFCLAKKIRKLRIAWERREKRLQTKIKRNRIFYKNTKLRAMFAHIKKDSLNFIRENNHRIPEEKMERYKNSIHMELKDTEDLMKILDFELTNLREQKISLGLTIEEELSKILLYASSKNFQNCDLSTNPDSQQSEIYEET